MAGMEVRRLVWCAAIAILTACSPDAPPPARDAGVALAAAGTGTDSGAVRIVLGGVNLTGVGYDIGNPAAPITMIEFSDFGCPYCAQHALQTLPPIRSEFIDSGRVFYKYVPFVIGMFPNGESAARAAECAGDQGEFWPMHDGVYERQNDWKRGRDPVGVLTEVAGGVVPDVNRWKSCFESGSPDPRTRIATEAASRLGVRATPTFFINGQMVEGALPLGVMRGGLRAMLEQARQ
jgi:hypothetical protein